MSLEIEGNIIVKGETESFGNNGFTKRTLVIETDEQYKQKIPVDFVKDKTALLDSFNLRDKVKVSINIRGNEYQGKYYVNLQGWRIEKISNGATEPKEPIKPQLMTPQQAFEPAGELDNPDDQDPLPF